MGESRNQALAEARLRWQTASVTFGTPARHFVVCSNCGRKRLHRRNCLTIDRNVTLFNAPKGKGPSQA